MEDELYNPVFNALLSGDTHLALGSGKVRYFNEELSPFAGFEDGYDKGFEELYQLLPTGRKIIYAIPEIIKEPRGWEVKIEMKGLQFVFKEGKRPATPSIKPVALSNNNITEMMQLAALTKPGPFGRRTIEFGQYYGFFENEKLIAMTGQRLHVGNYTEISAVCTHPDHLGKGLATALLLHQLELILSQGQKAFLHVRADNGRAIEVYERLGFQVSRSMNFYFLKRKDAI
jgi:ribosomal protein S18 acetylase RimI-like enzyme